MTEPHAWPLDESARGTLRPWYFTAAGYLVVLFQDPAEAQRAQRDLQYHGVPDEELRLYQAEETLRIVSRLQQERSTLAKAIAALVVDRPAKDRYLGNARAGGAALWILASTKDHADRLVGFLADYHYQFLHSLDEDGVEDVAGTSADLSGRLDAPNTSTAIPTHSRADPYPPRPDRQCRAGVDKTAASRLRRAGAPSP